MCERKKTGVHGTLQMIPMAWKFNSKQLLCKTLNSRMNIIKTRAVLNIGQTGGKCAPEAKREDLELIRRYFFVNRLFSRMISLKARAIGTLNIDRKIFKLKQIHVFLKVDDNFFSKYIN